MVAVDDVPIDIASIDFSDLEKQYSVDQTDSYIQTVLIVDNVPLVDEQKEEKLVSVLRKIMAKSGGKLKEGVEGLCMPMVEDPAKGKKMSKGYVRGIVPPHSPLLSLSLLPRSLSL